MALEPSHDQLVARIRTLETENEQLRQQLTSVAREHPGSDRFTTQVDLSGLMRVVSDHLYSSPIVAIRELVQNAHDSIIRRRRVDPRWAGGTVQLRVIDGLQLQVVDDGVGMSEADVHDFLATVGRGETGNLRRGGTDDELIGQFGLGFLSAFVLGSRVEVVTVSEANSDHVVRYTSDDGLTYSVTSSPNVGVAIGSTVTITLRDCGLSLADEDRLRRLLSRYCCLLRVPVRVGAQRINLVAPWHPARPGEGLAPGEFAAHFDGGFEPLAIIPIGAEGNADQHSVAVDLTGMLWVQSYASYASSDNRNLSVFVRGMLLDADARDLLPRWAGFVGGVIESNSLAPTASREDIQRNEAYESATTAIADALRKGLADLVRDLPAVWRRIVYQHNDALIGAAIADAAVFELVADDLTVSTTAGNLLPRDLAARGTGRVFVGESRGGGFAAVLYHSLGIPIAHGDRFGVAQFLRRWCARHDVDLIEIGTQQADTLFHPTALSPDDEAFLSTSLAAPGERLIPARFTPSSLPFVMVRDHEADLRERVESDEAAQRIPLAALALARAHTAGLAEVPRSRLYVNVSCPAIREVLRCHRVDAAHAAREAARLRALKIVLNMASGNADERSSLDWALRTLGAAPDAPQEG